MILKKEKINFMRILQQNILLQMQKRNNFNNDKNSSDKQMKSTDHYENIAKQYSLHKQMPLRQYFETQNVIDAVDLKAHEDIVDVACGDGFYTRIWRDLTKGKVYGLDLSENMIQLAKL